MKRIKKEISRKSGLPPGTLVHIGEVRLDKTSLDITVFNAEELHERVIQDPESVLIPSPNKNKWISVVGLHQTEVIGQVGQLLKIDPLLLEDLLNTNQRPKFEDFDDRLFFTMKAFYFNENDVLESEQLSFVLAKDFLVSFQESGRPFLEPIRERIRSSRGKVRAKGHDYLLYTLIDVLVDQYFSCVEHIGDKLDNLEEIISVEPEPSGFETTLHLRKDIGTLSKTLLPLRDALQKLKNDDSPLTGDEMVRYYSDVLDHVVQLTDTLDSFREISAEIKDTYMSGISFRTNQVVKLLTIITTIFIPMTFVVGIYGMNFRNMPELEWKYGYLAVWCFMVIMMSAMVIMIRKKRWL
jgi:magnesium transporter